MVTVKAALTAFSSAIQTFRKGCSCLGMAPKRFSFGSCPLTSASHLDDTTPSYMPSHLASCHPRPLASAGILSLPPQLPLVACEPFPTIPFQQKTAQFLVIRASRLAALSGVSVPAGPYPLHGAPPQKHLEGILGSACEP